MRSLKLFYSWQMDRPSNLCRAFIGHALDEARGLLAAQDIALEIDSDTRGEPGTPPISETILRKIRECDVFLADMTFVAAAGDKLIPNPNVMGEYGYALRDKGNRRILLAMNTAFGPPEKLPFDLHHLRHPEQYFVDEATPDGARRSARSKFAELLADYILAIAKDIEANPPPTEKAQRDALREEWWKAVQARSLNDPPAIVSVPYALVHVVAAGVLESEDLDPRDVRKYADGLRLADDPHGGTDGRQWWSHGDRRQADDRLNAEVEWYGRILQPGTIEFAQMIGSRIDNDPTIVVKGTQVEAEIVWAADHGLELAAALRLSGPYAVGVVLYGLDDVELRGPRRHGRFRKAALDLPLTIIPAGAPPTAGNHMRRAFDQLWMSAGFETGSPSYEEEEWAGYRN